MISGTQLLLVLIAGIAPMVRWRFFPLPASLCQRIHDELQERLRDSAPHLPSTFDGVSFNSGSSTSR